MRQKDLLNLFFIENPIYIEDVIAELNDKESVKNSNESSIDDMDYQEAYDSDLVD